MAMKVTPEIEAKIGALVASGNFPDEAAVLTAAVELLEESQEEIAWLRRELAVAEEQIARGETHEFTRERFEMIRARAFAEK